MRKPSAIILTVCAVLSLSACEGAKKQLGLQRQTPDEFSVVKRAPLEMPPDFTLRPPQPGASRPQEQKPHDEARTVVFGSEEGATQATAPAAATDAETILLQQAGADKAEPDIRQIVDKETAELKPKEEPVAKKLLGIGKDDPAPATVVDAKAEAERLKKNREEGKPATEGETPSIEQ